MIKIRRIDCPPRLDSSNRTLVKSDYNHNEVLDALLKMQHFKCCYCEKELSSLGKSERWVDHFVAKTDDSFKDADGNINWNEANAWATFYMLVVHVIVVKVQQNHLIRMEKEI